MSFSLCLLGFLITSEAPHLGALMGFLVGGSLGILILQVSRFDPQSKWRQTPQNDSHNYHQVTTRLDLLSKQVQQLGSTDQHEFKKTEQSLQKIKIELDKLTNDLNKLKQAFNLKKNQVKEEPINSSKDDVLDNSCCPPSPHIQQWLNSYQVKVVNSHIRQDADAILDQTAIFIGSHYSLLSDMLHKIRQSLSLKNFGFQIHLTGESEQKISAVTNLGTTLKNMGLLSYSYQNKGRQRIAHIRTLNSHGNQFLTGEWLERYIYHLIQKVLEQKDINYEALMNVVVKWKDGSQAEIDLLFFLKNRPLWIECKVANCEEAIARYSKLSDSFDLTQHQFFLVGLDLAENQAKVLTDIHHIQVLSPEDVPAAIENSLRVFDGHQPSPHPRANSGDLSSHPTTSQALKPYPLTSQEQLQIFLTQTDLRPLPEFRSHLIQKLIERVTSQLKPQLISDIKDGLYSDFDGQLSKTKISGFLKICLKGRCFLSETNQPVLDFQTPVARLSCQNTQELEQYCIEGLAYRVLTQDLEYFQSRHKCEHFQAVVGAAPPDASRIAVLKQRIDNAV
ncbi:hypothetical protein AY600_02945 [Phormidium willei BDU 130791]|nr:hypothetical protein AY600_02945 [Phormidium willei BDU 130791]